MAIIKKLIKLTSMTGLVDFPERAVERNIDSNQQTMSIFYDDTWVTGTRDIVVFFEGGSGAGDDTVDYGRVKYVVDSGRIYIRFSAYPTKPIWYTYLSTYPVHDYAREAHEPELVLEELFINTVNDPVLKRWVRQDSKVVLTGTSRGAGAILQWSKATRGIFKDTYRTKVVGIVANSPAGGGTTTADGTMRWAGPQVAQRALVDLFQHCNHNCLGLFGAGDLTHTPRSIVEIAKIFVTNPLVELRVVGDIDYPHGWPGLTAKGQYMVFFNMVFEYLPQR